MLGITVCVAAGDNGAADMGPRVWDGQAHVDFHLPVLLCFPAAEPGSSRPTVLFPPNRYGTRAKQIFRRMQDQTGRLALGVGE